MIQVVLGIDALKVMFAGNAITEKNEEELSSDTA
jgi:hypothetical protein